MGKIPGVIKPMIPVLKTPEQSRGKLIFQWISLTLALIGLLSSVIFIFLELFFLPEAWYPYHTSSLLEALKLEPIKLIGTPITGIFSRDWQITKPTTLKLNFRARIDTEISKDIWGFSMDSFKSDWIQDTSGSFLRIQVPTGIDPYLYRSVLTPSPISGKRFRVSLQMRARVPIALQGCRGVWLQENGGSYASQCFPVALNKQWESFNFEWQAPLNALSKSVRVVINDFDGLEFDIRDLKVDWQIDDGWKALTPLEPTGAVMLLDWIGRDKNAIAPYLPLVVDRQWHDYSISTSLPIATKLTVNIVLQPNYWAELQDFQLDTRQANLVQKITPLIKPFRSAIWFGDPNIAGHSLAAIALFTVLLTPNLWIGIVGITLGLVGIFFTESRAAWIAAAIGLPWLFWFVLSKKLRLWFFGAISIIILTAISVWGTDFFGRLATVDQIGVTRQSIWNVALDSIRQNLWTGTSDEQFSKIYAERYPTIPMRITHAHNLWLESGVRFGLLGLIVSGGLSLALVAFFWKYGRWRALAFLLPIFLMNVLDYSLEYIGILAPFILGSIWVLIDSNSAKKSRDSKLNH
jgi:hypothetical protein